MVQKIKQQIAIMSQHFAYLYQQGRYKEAMGIANQAVSMASQFLGKDNPHYAASLNNLALLYSKMGNYTAAEPLLKEATEIRRRLFGENDPQYAGGLNNLASLYIKMGNYAAAEPLFKQALEIHRTQLGEDHPEFAKITNNLAGCYYSTGNYTAAETLFKQAIEINRKLGTDHPGYAQSLNNLAALYTETGRYVAAEPILKQALEIRRNLLGENHPDYAESIHNLAALYVKMGNYVAAEPLYLEAMEIYRRVFSENHPAYLTSLDCIVELYLKVGNYVAAEPLLKQAIEILRTLFKENHPNYATGLDDLASLYQDMGNFAAAEPLLRQALEIRREALGKNHPQYIKSLSNLSLLYLKTGNYLAAEPLSKQIEEIYRTLAGENNLHYAQMLNLHADLYSQNGHYAEAEQLCQQALEIRRDLLGEAHPDYAESLNHLAKLYLNMGKYKAAEPLLKQGLEIHRTQLGESHPEYAESLINLAVLYEFTGNYAAAEPLYQQAMEILRTHLGENRTGKDQFRYAGSLNNLANLYVKIGRHALAEPLLKQSVEIRRDVFGETHPNYVLGLHNLAGLYESMGDYNAAISLLMQVVEMRRTQLGENHPDYALSLNNLAMLLELTGDYKTSASILMQTIEIYRTALGENHPNYAMSLNNLGLMFRCMGDYEAAEPLYQEAMEIRRTQLGENHPEYAESLQNLAGLYAATSRVAEAMRLMEHALAIEDQMIGQIFSIGSESQRMEYLERIRIGLDWFLSLVSQYFPHSSKAVRSALSLVLRRKAIGAEALATQRDVVLGGKYPALEPKLRELSTIRMQIAQKTLAGPGPEGLLAHQKLLASWNKQKELLEVQLAKQIPEMNLEQKLRDADPQTVALALPEGAVLVEFVRLDVFDFKAVPARREQRRKPARYLAFILPAGEPDNVKMLDLGEAEPIDKLMMTFCTAITDGDDSQSLHNHGSKLRSAIFDRLLEAAGKINRLLLAPDGDLTRLPFEVLPTPDGRHLIDDYRISYVAVGRDVLRFAAPSMGQASAAVVFADPDFDLTDKTTTGLEQQVTESVFASSTPSSRGFWSRLFGGKKSLSPVQKTQPTKASTSTVTAQSTPSRLSRDLNLGTLHFVRLPGTEVEGQQVAEILGVKPHFTSAALESRLKSYRSPRVLHVATHGFFLPDQKRDPNKQQRNLTSAGPSNDLADLFSQPGLENPLLRSGLALAGANTWLRKGNVPPEAEDGILTAEDVSGLDLLSTELVVLSACDTGLGEVHRGEGVFGLRRAFVLAGAKTLVMSLWSVPDLATAVLMERFYGNLIRRRMERDEALREAQVHVRRVTVGELRGKWLNEEIIQRLAAGQGSVARYLRYLAQRKDEHQPFVHPSNWGAFICQGDMSALS